MIIMVLQWNIYLRQFLIQTILSVMPRINFNFFIFHSKNAYFKWLLTINGMKIYIKRISATFEFHHVSALQLIFSFQTCVKNCVFLLLNFFNPGARSLFGNCHLSICLDISHQLTKVTKTKQNVFVKELKTM